LNRIITGDEMWVHYSELETKAQSKQWKRAGSPPPKKFKLSPSPGKVILVAFWDSRIMILTHSIAKGQTVTAKYYSEVILKNLREKLKQMRPLPYSRSHSGGYQLLQMAIVVSSSL
jgi:hypothetical protein